LPGLTKRKSGEENQRYHMRSMADHAGSFSFRGLTASSIPLPLEPMAILDSSSGIREVGIHESRVRRSSRRRLSIAPGTFRGQLDNLGGRIAGPGAIPAGGGTTSDMMGPSRRLPCHPRTQLRSSAGST
jgi:hypothetical protein